LKHEIHKYAILPVNGVAQTAMTISFTVENEMELRAL
jgi:hypothetical protein